MYRIVVLLVALVVSATARSVTLDSVDSGWYRIDGSHTPSNQNYAVGNFGGTYYNNFFVFDLSSQTEAITGATLSLFNPALGYLSVAAETYSVFDVSTDIAVLTAGTGGIGAFADLGSGTLLGSHVFETSATNAGFVSIPLNQAALAYLNVHIGGLVALGGAITTLNDDPNSIEHAFVTTGSPTCIGCKQLILDTTVVPVHTAAWLIAPAFGWLAPWVRRRCASATGSLRRDLSAMASRDGSGSPGNPANHCRSRG